VVLTSSQIPSQSISTMVIVLELNNEAFSKT
jgi:hypothetical protein